jgi:hypothetical protein
VVNGVAREYSSVFRYFRWCDQALSTSAPPT